MSKWEYKIIRWDSLTVGGANPSHSLEKNLNEHGAEGWRLDRQVTLEVASPHGGSQQVEYAVLARADAT